jgi:citrate synthase
VASAGSTPYALVAAGLAALQGSKHGGACERAEGLLQESRDARGARHAVMARLRARTGSTDSHPSHVTYGDTGSETRPRSETPDRDRAACCE